jgi:actin-like ATPase involved in cell morphogenesis
LLLDVGHGGSRLYPYLDGRHRPDLGAVVSHGGAKMLRAVRHMTRERGNLRIGERTSGQLLGQLTASGTKLVAVKGIDLSADRPAERSFSWAMAEEALRPTHDAISEACRRVLGGLPGGRQDAARILLSGGAATPALAEFLRSSLELEVFRPACPRRLSALGHVESGNASL